MDRYQKASYSLGNLIELVLKAMVGIVVVYLLAKELLKLVFGESSAQIISAILGIVMLFAVIVSKRVRKEILHFGNGGRKKNDK
jgi:O-antigen/teichoic acid export membrane protein